MAARNYFRRALQRTAAKQNGSASRSGALTDRPLIRKEAEAAARRRWKRGQNGYGPK